MNNFNVMCCTLAFARRSVSAVWAGLLVLGFASAACGAWYAVATVEGFQDALPKVKPGDEILIIGNRYADWTLSVNVKGSADKPIVIRAAIASGAVFTTVFTGKSKLTLQDSEHVVVRDLAFDGCKVTNKAVVLLENARNCRLTACRFVDSVGKKNDQVVQITGKSRDNRIDQCTFSGNAARAVQIHVEPAWETEGYPVGTRIDHNRFQDVPSVEQGDNVPNGRETIQVGQGIGSESEPKTIVENNIFLRCNGENKCISNKTAGNIYRYNLFQDQAGCLSLRGAARCVVEGNRFENMPGLHVQGKGHTIVHNVFVRCGGNRKPGKQSIAGCIALGYGMERRPESEFPQHYKAAEECLVANNTIVDPPLFGLFLGGGKGQDWRAKGVRSVPPSKNRIVNNLIVGQTGELLISDDAPNNVVDHNLISAGGQATVAFYGENALKTAPRFRDAATGDYRLAPDSPGLNAGISIRGVLHSEHIGALTDPVQYGPSEKSPSE